MKIYRVVVGVLMIGCGSAGTSDGDVNQPAEATLVMEPFTVDPGGEVFVCQTFANPFRNAYVRAFESHMSVGSHHLILNAEDSEPSGIAPCSGLIAPTGPFATQVPDDEYSYPDGVGAFLAGGSNLLVVSHYLNTTTEAIAPTVTVTLRRAPTGSVSKQALMGSWVNLNIDIPAHQTVTASSYGGFGEDSQVLWLLPHMHSRGTHFEVTIGEANPVTIFETDDWETAPHRFDPPQPVRADERVSYSCTWKNDTDFTLTFGESAATNEMCLVALQYVADE